MSHTQGPWKNQGEFVFAGTMDGKLIATVHDCAGVNRTAAEMAREISVKEGAANNSLICAAPDLLAALKLFESQYRTADLDTQKVMNVIHLVVKKAIAKAETTP